MELAVHSSTELPAIVHGSEHRLGDWLQTFSGKKFYPIDPRPEEVFIEDIAHALSNMCRFGGHCKQFYSVAEHSTRVSYACDPEDALEGLLHDASEAYLIDIPRPVKHSGYFEPYKIFEAKVQAVINERFGLRPEPESVKKADRVLLLTEQRDLMGNQVEPWKTQATPLDTHILPLPPAQAKLEFMIRFNELMKRKQN